MTARGLLNILKKARKPITNNEIDVQAIKYKQLLLLNTKWYAQRDLEYMGLMDRMYPKHKKMQKYFLTEKWKSIESFDEMIKYWWVVEQKKQCKRREKKLRHPVEEQEIKTLNKELNTTLLEKPAPAVRPSLFWRIISRFTK